MNRRSFLRFLGVSPALSVVDMTDLLSRQKDPWADPPYRDWREVIMMDFPNGRAPLIVAWEHFRSIQNLNGT